MKYIECNGEMPEEMLRKGYIFKSKLCNQDYFLIEIIVKKKNSNVIVNIYETETLQEQVKNNCLIAYPEYQTEKVVSIDVWNKYYFPTWNNDNNQYYHNEDGNEDYIGSRAEIMKKGLELGLKIGEIDTY